MKERRRSNVSLTETTLKRKVQKNDIAPKYKIFKFRSGPKTFQALRAKTVVKKLIHPPIPAALKKIKAGTKVFILSLVPKKKFGQIYVQIQLKEDPFAKRYEVSLSCIA